ncbi:MAG: mechanosensitive ion channel [Bacteroidales bacterium]|nr:mechanosensitive ion channel [Bacteroidales bacterium]MCF8328181.1 mechanosensitive ion channel [Bacteroidales bacterium]
MNEIQAQFSSSAVYLFLLIAIILFGLFRILNFTVPLLPLKTEQKKRFKKALPVVEFVAWFIFLIWGINYFIKYNSYFALALGILVLLIFIWFAWYALRDIIAGIIMKANRGLNLNDMVDIADYHGKIKRFGIRNLVLETENGKSIFLPYTMIIKQELIRSHPAEKILSHTFTLTTPKDKTIEQSMREIHKSLLSLPWTSRIKKPLIRAEQETEASYVFQITAYSIEKGYFVMIEKAIREAFSPSELETNTNTGHHTEKQ